MRWFSWGRGKLPRYKRVRVTYIVPHRGHWCRRAAHIATDRVPGFSAGSASGCKEIDLRVGYMVPSGETVGDRIKAAARSSRSLNWMPGG